MGLNLAVVSGKGGTGKSTLSCGLAIAFARTGKRVVLIDLDVGLRSLDIAFGVEKNVVFDLYDAINQDEYSNAFYYPEEFENKICIVPAPPKDKIISSEQFSEFYYKCQSEFDAVILDLPAGLDFSLLQSIDNLKYVCVSNPDPISIRDASVVADTLRENGIKPLLVVNKFSADLIRNKTYKNIDSMIDLSGIKLLGIIPNSTELMLLPVKHNLPHRSKAYKALDRIRRRLCGENILLPKPRRI